MPALRDQVLASPNLPTLPVAALRLVQLAQDPDVDIDAFARTLTTDPALTSRVLRAANSSYYGLANHVATVPRAVMVLGLSTVRMLALGFTLVQSMRTTEGPGFDYTEFWRRNLTTGVGARIIARLSAPVDPEAAFVGGMLHGVGILAIQGAIPREYAPVVAASRGDRAQLRQLEQARWQTDHTELAGELASSWDLPAALTAAVAHYLDVDAAPAEHRDVTRCVALASVAAEVAGENTADAYRQYLAHCLEWYDLDEAAAGALFIEVQGAAAEARDLFGLPDWGSVDPVTVLQRAHTALAELSLRSVEEQMRWRREAESLADEVATDALTGIANRRALDGRLTRDVQSARTAGSALSVLMIDLDEFKSINDSCGHATGDDVLRLVAGALRKGVRPRDLAARFGGDEFVVILPGSTKRAAAFVAERLRDAVSRLDVRAPDGTRVSVTSSFGVAEFDPSAHASPEALLADADQALYDAKRSGRNVVAVAPDPDVRGVA